VKSVDTVSDHELFAANILFGPALYEAYQGQVGAIDGGEAPSRKADRIDRGFVVRGELLNNIDPGIGHVAYTDKRSWWLPLNKFLKISQIISNGLDIQSLIDQNHQLKSRGLVTCRDQLCHCVHGLTLLYLDVVLHERRQLVITLHSHVRDDDVGAAQSVIRLRL
jgi:hypothetical protein